MKPTKKKTMVPKGIRAPHHFEQFVKKHRRIFVNRTLRMGSIRWVGFDLDHTLAMYNRNFIEALAFDMARQALVDRKGYPETLLKIPYDSHFGIRGLVVDKKLGNIIKMDKFRYVAKAYHGLQALPKDKRREFYSGPPLQLSSDRFWSSDTLFGLPEIALYASVVEALEEAGWPKSLSYHQLFTDIRFSVDLVHKDGSLKKIILDRMSECFVRDPKLPPTLDKLRSEGLKLFLLTNSDYEYTDQVLSWVLDDSARDRHWWEYFDLIVCESRKPDFFAKAPTWKAVEDKRHKVPSFTGGNYKVLQQQIGAKGDEILFVGDHIFGDILRSKKSSGWRTLMVVEELEYEILASEESAPEHRQLDKLQIENSEMMALLRDIRAEQDELRERKLGGYKSLNADQIAELDDLIRDRGECVQELDARLTSQLLQIKDVEKTIRDRFNPYWGPLFKVDGELSRFGDQLGDFACLYTSRISNYLNYPPGKFFQSRVEFLPHEL